LDDDNIRAGSGMQQQPSVFGSEELLLQEDIHDQRAVLSEFVL
jgi:hypothetical protein